MNWPKITLDTPIEELQRLHRVIWDFAIKHHKKPYNTPYRADCAACDYAYRQWKQDLNCVGICSYCPIQWPDGLICGDDGSLYRKYYEARKTNDLDAIEAIAKEIRDVPFETEVF